MYEVPPGLNGGADECVLVCEVCREQIEDPEKDDVHHWRCLNDSMWSQVPAERVVAWRMLKRLGAEGWSQDLPDMLCLDEDMLVRAQATREGESDEAAVSHVDVTVPCSRPVTR